MMGFLGGTDTNVGKKAVVANPSHFYQDLNGSASWKREPQISFLGSLNKRLPQSPTLKLTGVLSNIKPVLNAETLLFSKHDK